MYFLWQCRKFIALEFRIIYQSIRQQFEFTFGLKYEGQKHGRKRVDVKINR